MPKFSKIDSIDSTVHRYKFDCFDLQYVQIKPIFE